MIDKIFLTKDVKTLPTKLTNFTEKTNYMTGEIYNETHHNNFSIRCFENRVTLLGSLTKYGNGNNYEDISYNECLEQIDKLSENIGTDLTDFRIMQLEIGNCFEMNESPHFYIDNCLIFSRRESGVYYSKGKATGKTFETYTNKFVLYDKVKDAKAHKEFIKDDYKTKNLLRVEEKFNKKMKKTLNFIPTIKDLKNPSVKTKLLKDYLKKFNSIGRKMDIEIPENIRTLGDLRKALLLINTDRTEALLKVVKLSISKGLLKSSEASKIRSFLTKDRKVISNYFELQDTLNEELTEKITNKIDKELSETI